MITNASFKTFTLSKVKGVVAIEAALIIPILLLLAFATIELTSVLHARHAMIDAAREGARYAAIEDADTNQIKDRVMASLSAMSIKVTKACADSSCITITPNNLSSVLRGEPITVSLSLSASEVSIVPKNGIFGLGKIKMNVAVSMAKEK